MPFNRLMRPEKAHQAYVTADAGVIHVCTRAHALNYGRVHITQLLKAIQRACGRASQHTR